MRTYVVCLRPSSFKDRYEVKVKANSSSEAIAKAVKQEGYPVSSCELLRETKADKEKDHKRLLATKRLDRLQKKRARTYYQLKKDPRLAKEYASLKARISKTKKELKTLED